MDTYTPSGKHPPLGEMLGASLGIGAASGLAGGLTIFVFSRMSVALASGASPSRGLSFSNLLVAALAIWLAIFVPHGMGRLCAYGAARGSRDPRLSCRLALLSGLIAAALTIPVVMASYGITFRQWLGLGWATASGPSDRLSGLAFVHLIPVAVLLLTSYALADEWTRRPFCELCQAPCETYTLGRAVLPDAAVLAGRHSVVQLLQALTPIESAAKSPEGPWVEATLARCPRCVQTGFLSVVACHAETDGGKVVTKKEEVVSLLRLNPEELAPLIALQKARTAD
jgi:hypothetical protein